MSLLYETKSNFSVARTQVGQTLGFNLDTFIKTTGLTLPVRANSNPAGCSPTFASLKVMVCANTMVGNTAMIAAAPIANRHLRIIR